MFSDQESPKNNVVPPTNIADSLLRAVLLASNVIVLATDADGVLTYTNGTGLASLGFKPDDGVGLHIAEFLRYTQVEQEKVTRFLSGQPLATGTGTKALSEKLSPAASFATTSVVNEHYVELSLVPSFESDGTVAGLIGFSTSITECRKIDVELLPKQELLGDLFDSIPEITHVLDRNFRILAANKASRDIFVDTQIIGATCYRMISGMDKHCPFCPVLEMYKTEQPTRSEFYDDLRNKYQQLSCFPLRDQEGKIVGAVEMASDVTEMRIAQQALQQYQTELEQQVALRTRELAISEAKLRSILATSSAAISFADWQGNLTYFNKAYEDLFGYSQEELYGRSALSFSNGSDEDHQGFWDILDGKSDFNRTLTSMRAKDGRIVWTDISASVIRNSDPTQTQLITILVDATERQQILEELRRAKVAAEDANQAKSLFLATMSHEMRTPLNGVIGLSELLLSTTLQPKQLEYAKLIKTSGNTLLFLINDILDFSKIEAGKFELEDITFDFYQVVESVLGILSAKADEQKLALALTFEPNVPRPMRGDSGRLRQVLINMVGNGLKFTRQGGVRVHVSVEEIREKDIVVRFEVIDTGVGIPEQSMHRLFQPFSQVDASSARQYGGTGLGLSICKKLVELMGGQVGVHSVEGKGSTFWFNIVLGCSPVILKCMSSPRPLCVENRSMECHWNQSDTCSGCGYHAGIDLTLLSGMSALVVSANDIQLQATQTQLDSWGLVTETQSAHADAWESLNTALARKKPYRLVVIDTHSADCPGFQLIDRIIADDRLVHLVVIALVSLTAVSENTTYREKGVRFCSKPVSCSTLFEVVISACLRDLYQSNYAVQVAEMMPRVSLPPVSPRRSLKVLVAEDNRINQIVVVGILHNAGITTKVVANGREAFDAVRNEPFDIVLMDCQMPQMDGYEATGEIRNWERSQTATKRLPIIALTANATKGDEEKCLQAGMDAYCSKPINPKQIVELIDRWTVER